MINLPHASDSSREVGAETVLANNPLDRVDRMDEAADRLSEQAQDEAHRAKTTSLTMRVSRE